MKPKLEACSVSYSYHTMEGETPALSNISFFINPGEFLAVVGPSGCGKSTLLSLLSGLLQPEEGSILIDGIPIRDSPATIGYMFQKDHLFEWRTIYGNVSLGLEIQKKQSSTAQKELKEILSKNVEFSQLEKLLTDASKPGGKTELSGKDLGIPKLEKAKVQLYDFSTKELSITPTEVTSRYRQVSLEELMKMLVALL